MSGNASTELVNDILIAVSGLPNTLVWRANSGLFFTETGRRVRPNVEGCPDIVGCHRGWFVVIEVKYGSGRLLETQMRFRVATLKANGIHIVGRSVEQVLADLRALSPRTAAA